MSVVATANERRPSIEATTAARLLSLIVALAAFVIAFGPPRRAAQRFEFRRRDSRLFSAYSLRGPWGQGAPARDFEFRAEAVDRRQSRLVARHPRARIAWADGLPRQEGSRRSFDRLARRHLRRPKAPIRHSSRQRQQWSRRCVRRAVVLFAEATTGDGNRLLRFRSSQFEAVRLAACPDNGGLRSFSPSTSTIRASPGCRRFVVSGPASPGTATRRFSGISCSTPAGPA
jgi:hypothetical protein